MAKLHPLDTRNRSNATSIRMDPIKIGSQDRNDFRKAAPPALKRPAPKSTASSDKEKTTLTGIFERAAAIPPFYGLPIFILWFIHPLLSLGLFAFAYSRVKPAAPKTTIANPQALQPAPVADSLIATAPDRTQRRATEKAARAAENSAAADRWHDTVNPFGFVLPVFRRMRAGDIVRGHGPLATIAKVIAAFALYFLLMKLDMIFGFNQMLTGTNGINSL